MDTYKETFETWNNVAHLYQEKFMTLDIYNSTYDYVCTSIKHSTAKLLEIGCGPGNITKYILSQRPQYSIFGIDISPNMVDLATKNNPSANFAVMDCRDISKLNTKFDGIIGGFCLPYLSQEECSELISTAYRLLNDEGLIYLSFVEGAPDLSGFITGSGGRVYFYYHTLNYLTEQLANANFKLLKTFNVQYKKSDPAFDIHTVLIAKK